MTAAVAGRPVSSRSADAAYRPEIDGLRAIAVVSVVAFHLDPDLCPGGFVGVDVFFVISGYLICRILFTGIDERGFSLVGFYERRVRRILPALFAMLAITSLAAAILLPPTTYESFANSAAWAAASVSNFFFSAHSGYFDLGSNSLPLLHTWSLGVEEQFYAVFPLVFFLGRRVLRLPWAVTIGGMAALSFVVCVAQTASSPSAAFYSPIARSWEFLLGGALAAGFIPRCGPRASQPAGAVGLGLLAAAFVLIDQKVPFPGWRVALPVIGSGLLIWSTDGRPSWAGWLLRQAPMRAIGRISYSLYLWHWPVFVFARIFYGGSFPPLVGVALVVIATLLAYASWRWIEEPPRRNRALFTRSRLFVGAALLVALFFAQRWCVNHAHGLPARFSPEASAYLQDEPGPNLPTCIDGVLAPPCRIGAPGALVTFGVIGDSFGEASLPGLDAVARRAGRAGLVFDKGGCYPLLDAELGDPTCARFMRAAVTALRSNASIATVLLIGRWPAAVEGRRFGSQNTPTPPLADSVGPGGTRAANGAVLLRSLGRTVVALGPRRVFIVAAVPEQSVDVPTSAAVRANLGLNPVTEISRSAFERRSAAAQAILAQVSRATGATVLDPTPLLCGPAVCPGTIDGHAIYRDDNHLNIRGSVLVADKGLYAPAFAH